MKLLFAIFLIFVAIHLSKNERGDLCLRRGDCMCRTARNKSDIIYLNNLFHSPRRKWSVTDMSDCKEIYKLNQLRFCESVCERVRKGDFSGLDCSGRKTACVANEKTQMCTVYREQCQAAAECCNAKEKVLFMAEDFRCSRNGLIRKGQTGKCHPQSKE